MQGSEQYWENMDNHWEDEGSSYTGFVDIGSSDTISLYPTTADVVAQTAVVKFVYVKNAGDNAVQFTINGSNYDIIIPSNGSVSFRGDGTNLQMRDLKAQSSSGSSIEFILAT